MSTPESRKKSGQTKYNRTEEKIFGAIAELSKKFGVSGWTLTQVADTAGISLATIQKHYPSLYELQQTVLRRAEPCPTCEHLVLTSTR